MISQFHRIAGKFRMMRSLRWRRGRQSLALLLALLLVVQALVPGMTAAGVTGMEVSGHEPAAGLAYDEAVEELVIPIKWEVVAPAGLQSASIPLPPLNLGWTSDYNWVELTWDPPAEWGIGDHRYVVRRDGEEVWTSTWSGSNTSYKDSYLEPGKTHYFEVLAEDSAGNLSDPAAVTARTLDVDYSMIRASVSAAGVANNRSNMPALSADGRYVAFDSTATNLVDGDTNSRQDIFVYDRDADGNGVLDEPGTISTVRVSVSSAGGQANGYSSSAALSADGRFVAFTSNATNLVDGDTNGRWDIFVHDRDADRNGVFDEPGWISTVRVSISTGGDQADGKNSYSPALSADGRFVVFTSEATNLVAGDINGFSGYLRP